jgi:hypothetical protein
MPSRAICTGFTSDEYKAAVKEGYAWLGGFAELRNLTWVDLPTTHWPMWSRPKELAAVIGDVARTASARQCARTTRAVCRWLRPRQPRLISWGVVERDASLVPL